MMNYSSSKVYASFQHCIYSVVSQPNKTRYCQIVRLFFLVDPPVPQVQMHDPNSSGLCIFLFCYVATPTLQVYLQYLGEIWTSSPIKLTEMSLQISQICHTNTGFFTQVPLLGGTKKASLRNNSFYILQYRYCKKADNHVALYLYAYALKRQQQQITGKTPPLLEILI